MKKRNLILAFLLAVCGLAANALTITLSVNDAAALQVRTQEGFADFSQGPVTVNVPVGSMIMARPNEGYNLKSVTDKDGKELDVSYGAWSIILSEAQEGQSYHFVAEAPKPEDIKTFTINVDDASKVYVMYMSDSGFSSVELVNGDNTVEFDVNHMLEFAISPKNYSQLLYQVRLDGKVVESEDGVNWSVKPTEGCRLEIQANYPDQEVLVSFQYPEGGSGCLSEVRVGGKTVEGFDGNSVKVTMGQELEMVADKGFVIDGGQINGERFYWNGYYPYSFRVTGPTTVYVNARPLVDINMTVIVNHADHVKVYAGIAELSEPLQLQDGENHVKVRETASSLSFTIDPECYLIQALADGDPVMFNSCPLKEGGTLLIETEKIAYDKHAAIWLDSAPADAAQFTLANLLGIAPLQQYKQGYNVMDFYYGLNPFELSWASTVKGKVFHNGTLLTPSDPDFNVYSELEFTDGDVLKVFLVSQPKQCTVSIDLGGEDITVTRDIIVPVTEGLDNISCLAGTKFRLEYSGSKALYFTINGNELPALPDAPGVWEFEPEGTDTVVKLGSTGIENVSCDSASAADKAVYNLQGVRVADSLSDSLPAGIYVSAGRKVLVK